MAVFQVLRGKAENLKKRKFHDGYMYFTPDDGALYIDSELDGEKRRTRINPAQPGAVDALNLLYETGILTPAYHDNTFFTAPTGEIYIL